MSEFSMKRKLWVFYETKTHLSIHKTKTRFCFKWQFISRKLYFYMNIVTTKPYIPKNSITISSTSAYMVRSVRTDRVWSISMRVLHFAKANISIPSGGISFFVFHLMNVGPSRIRSMLPGVRSWEVVRLNGITKYPSMNISLLIPQSPVSRPKPKKRFFSQEIVLHPKRSRNSFQFDQEIENSYPKFDACARKL